MLSTAQKTVNAIHQKREDEVIDEWGHQPRVRKPAISIDIATVVGITVGAFLFILIGTGERDNTIRLYRFSLCKANGLSYNQA